MAKTTVVRTAAKSKAVVGANARAIAKTEPVAAKKKAGKTRNPLAPERVAAILDALRKTYPGVVCALNHKNAWELTVATILSAQCTDVRVNLVTPALFKTFPTPKAMAAASLPELEELIRTTGFFRNKAKSIQGAARVVVEEFGGRCLRRWRRFSHCREWPGRPGMWCWARGSTLRLALLWIHMLCGCRGGWS
ncbi:endonuclease III domain-containing protein [Tunturiibacter gelidiferens]|uniref:endonuclease III domain-containing protein n=1 Tax=Tunturiibacter gelidiferens TaxID=3069689 RepID=UPI003D9B4A31